MLKKSTDVEPVAKGLWDGLVLLTGIGIEIFAIVYFMQWMAMLKALSEPSTVQSCAELTAAICQEHRAAQLFEFQLFGLRHQIETGQLHEVCAISIESINTQLSEISEVTRLLGSLHSESQKTTHTKTEIRIIQIKLAHAHRRFADI